MYQLFGDSDWIDTDRLLEDWVSLGKWWLLLVFVDRKWDGVCLLWPVMDSTESRRCCVMFLDVSPGMD